jgi:lambda repressor-like predicted transcriptional regulator
MKVYIDKEKVLSIMRGKGIKTIKQLCVGAGIEQDAMNQTFWRKGSSPRLSWLIADFLECDVMDFWSVDWNA